MPYLQAELSRDKNHLLDAELRHDTRTNPSILKPFDDINLQFQLRCGSTPSLELHADALEIR